MLPAVEQLKSNLEQPEGDRCVDIQHGFTPRAQLTIGRPAPTAEGSGDMVAELQYTIALEIAPSAIHAMKIVDDGDGPLFGPLHGGNIGNLNRTLIVNDVLRRWQEAVRKQSAREQEAGVNILHVRGAQALDALGVEPHGGNGTERSH